jgi:hypothetical protein
MATIDEDDSAEKIPCRLGSNCAEFSAAVCSAIGGTLVDKCEIKTACIINEVCINNLPIETCEAMSGTILNQGCNLTSVVWAKDFSPIWGLHATYYYNLKGEPLGAAKPATPGIYIEKTGKTARKILVK